MLNQKRKKFLFKRYAKALVLVEVLLFLRFKMQEELTAAECLTKLSIVGVLFSAIYWFFVFVFSWFEKED